MIGIRKRSAPPPEEGVQLGLIITPMLDVAFQLMAFFIMVYNPSPMETHLQGKLLPFAKGATAGPQDKLEKKDDTPPIDKEPETKENLRVLVKAVGKGRTERGRADGEPTDPLLKRPEAADPIKLADTNDDFEKVALPRLVKELKAIREGPGGAEMTVSIDPDANLKYE